MTSPARIGSYRVERLLGTGSFAMVWLGHDPSLDARVAIKVLAENWSHDLRVRERFLDEARLLWRLDDERVIRVHSLGELPDGRPYMVMAWADGGSLRDRLAAGPIRSAAALWVLREVAAGVAVLHATGIVHRDLTPGNVLFRSTGARAGRPAEQVVIADLGLAKALAAASGLTARAGTPGYMAPEQDDPLAVVDARADVYGLGRLGARLLTVSTGQRVRLRAGVPPGVAGVLRRATAVRPTDRFRDAAAFAAAFDAATGTRDPSALRRRRGIVTAGAVLVATGVAAGLSGDAGPAWPAEIASDRSGRIAVTLPPGWRGVAADWPDPLTPAGGRQPALMVSPAPAVWRTDPRIPGAFVGLSRADTTPAAYVADHPHPRCVAAPTRTVRRAGVDWVVAAYSACPGPKATIVEAAGRGLGTAGLVYVQVVPPAGGGPEFVDALLSGIRVRAS
ncbi:serine/threonine-protein kinase [Asanoa sp. NPDC049573]|uniref:serine/threonine-protein kinase n=1 Tax=Asanoa sp. NPDC049573 TaxID=3155396 RepID=UPI003429DF08